MMDIPVYDRFIRGTGMPTSILYLATGLILAFAVTSALSSAATEGVARLVGLRAEFLLRGLYELLDAGNMSADLSRRDMDWHTLREILRGDDSRSRQPSVTSALLASPLLRNLTRADVQLTLTPARVTGGLPKLAAHSPVGVWRQDGRLASHSPVAVWRQYRRLPTHIPPASFAEAVIDLMVPDAAGQTTMATIQQNVNRLTDSQASFRSSMQALVKSAGDDTAVFSASVERWFDNQMVRVSREYKRHVTKIAVAIGAVIVVLFNINALTIARNLYTGSAVNAAVSKIEAKNVTCSGMSTEDCVARFRAQASAAAGGLPIGWPTTTDCAAPGALCNWMDQRGIFSRHGGSFWEAAGFFLGFLLTIVALIPGARFWYGLLTKAGLGL